MLQTTCLFHKHGCNKLRWVKFIVVQNMSEQVILGDRDSQMLGLVQITCKDNVSPESYFDEKSNDIEESAFSVFLDDMAK